MKTRVILCDRSNMFEHVGTRVTLELLRAYVSAALEISVPYDLHCLAKRRFE